MLGEAHDLEVFETTPVLSLDNSNAPRVPASYDFKSGDRKLERAMAIGFAGGEADVPLARTIVGAVIVATLLPKFVVPCLYVLVKRRPNTDVATEPGWA